MDETLAKALEILRLAALQERGEVYFWHAESPNQSSEGWPAIEICSNGFGRWPRRQQARSNLGMKPIGR
jgi:hypothetical protein